MRLVRPSDSAVMQRLLEDLESASPTSDGVGSTLAGEASKRFRRDHIEIVLGHGTERFHRAIRGLKTWKAHRVPGMRVFPRDREIRTGATVVVTWGTPTVALAAPCRIVGVTDEPTRWGFAYATLPGHPEQGEESFVVSRSPDDTVHFEIEALSRPGDPLVRLSGSIGRALQRAGTRGYLRALKRFVDEDAG